MQQQSSHKASERSEPEINGATRIYTVVADPIAQVQTPAAVNAVFRARDMNAVMVPTQVAAQDLHDYFQAVRQIKNFAGMVVTVPHKQAAAILCDETTATARMVGAVNVVRREPDGRLIGDILDGKGFIAGLRSQSIEPANMRVFLAGAGGAASAIAFALAEAGVKRLGIHNRTAARVQQLLTRLTQHYPGIDTMACSSAQGFDLVINATSLGMKQDDPLPLETSALSANQIVAEVIMKPALTPLLQHALERGCRIQFGKPMLDAQIELMVNFMGAQVSDDE